MTRDVLDTLVVSTLKALDEEKRAEGSKKSETNEKAENVLVEDEDDVVVISPDNSSSQENRPLNNYIPTMPANSENTATKKRKTEIGKKETEKEKEDRKKLDTKSNKESTETSLTNDQKMGPSTSTTEKNIQGRLYWYPKFSIPYDPLIEPDV